MNMNIITNEHRIAQLMSTNNSILNALLWERIQTIMDLTKQDLEKNPASYNTMVPLSCWKDLLKNVESVKNMQEPEQSIFIITEQRHVRDILDRHFSENKTTLIDVCKTASRAGEFLILKSDNTQPTYSIVNKMVGVVGVFEITTKQLKELEQADLVNEA